MSEARAYGANPRFSAKGGQPVFLVVWDEAGESGFDVTLNVTATSYHENLLTPTFTTARDYYVVVSVSSYDADVNNDVYTLSLKLE